MSAAKTRRAAQGRVRRQASSTSGEAAPGGYETILMTLLHKVNRPLRLDEILRITHLPRKSKKSLEAELFALQEKGRVVRAPGGWTLREGLRRITGVLALQRAGMGFVSPEGGGQDVYIHPSALNGAWHGDRVEALVLPGKRGPSAEGRILRVLERTRSEVAAYAMRKQPEGWVCTPANTRLPALFLADKTETPDREDSKNLPLPEIREGDLLILRPEEELGPNYFRAVILANLEHEHSPAAQERIVKSNHGIPGPFPHAALQAALQVARQAAGHTVPQPAETRPRNADEPAAPALPQAKDLEGRTDLTGLGFVTIDGRTARDFDDAVYVEELPPAAGKEPGAAAAFRLLVAIADVSHYVRQDDPLDAESRLRGNSCYFPLSVEPMLPEALSNDLCSLKPGVPRLVMVADMRFAPSGQRLAAAFYPAVIRSAARLTYGQVQRGLLLGLAVDAANLGSALPMLRSLESLARILHKSRKERGSLDFDLPESEHLFSETGELIDIRKRERHFAHRMIEECMLAANEAVAEFLSERSEPALYRVHQPPDPDKLRNLTDFLFTAGLAPASSFFKARQGRGSKGRAAPPSARELSAILESLRAKPEEYLVTRLLLRAMMQAGYQSENEGHYGLASRCYCHFTSPIRRYADLLVHRSLKQTLGLAPQDERKLTRSRLEAIARHLNEKERAATDAEREIHKRLTILFLHGKEGTNFPGVISGVTDFGLFVELPDLLAEGMIPLSALAGDYYDHFPERHELRGRITGTAYKLGMPLEVTLSAVSLSRLEIDLVPAQGSQPPRARKTTARTRPGPTGFPEQPEQAGLPAQPQRSGRATRPAKGSPPAKKSGGKNPTKKTNGRKTRPQKKKSR